MSASGKGPARGYSWPPFAPGHTASETSGYRSDRRIGPLAEQLAAALLDSEHTPDYLRDDPSFRPAIAAYCRSEAIVALLTAYLDTFDIEAALTETISSTETEDTTGTAKTGTRTTRVTEARRVQAALAALDRHEARANSLRQQLGLTPMSRAKVLRDLAATRWMAGPSLLDRELDRIEAERRQAIEAGDGGG